MKASKFMEAQTETIHCLPLISFGRPCHKTLAGQ
jgi:hypothetical protein